MTCQYCDGRSVSSYACVLPNFILSFRLDIHIIFLHDQMYSSIGVLFSFFEMSVLSLDLICSAMCCPHRCHTIIYVV